MTCEDDYIALMRRFTLRFLDLQIMRMLLHEPLWGYRIMSMLKRRYDIRVGPPVIYPLLAKMEAKGLVESEEVYRSNRRRKVYRTTRKGLDLLKCFKDVLSSTMDEFSRSV